MLKPWDGATGSDANPRVDPVAPPSVGYRSKERGRPPTSAEAAAPYPIARKQTGDGKPVIQRFQVGPGELIVTICFLLDMPTEFLQYYELILKKDRFYS